MTGGSNKYYRHELTVLDKCGYENQPSAYEVNKLSDYHMGVPRIVLDCPHLRNFPLADNIDQPGKLDILIGADMMSLFLVNNPTRFGGYNEPYGRNTRLGWVIGGNFLSNKRKRLFVSHITKGNDDTILSRFWEMEECGVKSKDLPPLDEKGPEAIFEKRVRRLVDGRIEVPLPLKENIGLIGDSRYKALRRYNFLESRFRKSIKLCEEYCNVMKKSIDLGSAEEVPYEELKNKNPVFYLPRHAVIKESSSTTKLRIVFDGSMKSDSELSLNDCLVVGPKRQLDLIHLLFKWSFHKIALVSDITKMYSQVSISKGDRDLLRFFFWRENYNGPIKEFRHTRHVFGTARAAHFAISAVQWNPINYKNEFKNASKIILEDMYVDDVLTGANNIKEAQKLVADLWK
ncbi:uncharacterized protein [Lepeophtheirus salmonis]|uniref:uncharacterized protein n=1 Tax=Lepeophtheirus salmonis TaxID=72036 RepID=UPI001AE993EC|nr:uncharacterized protein LOC121115391 [Lepeophtheirus salmonis]